MIGSGSNSGYVTDNPHLLALSKVFFEFFPWFKRWLPQILLYLAFDKTEKRGGKTRYLVSMRSQKKVLMVVPI